MADISKIKLPSNNEYNIKDAIAREAIANITETITGGISYNFAWDGSNTPNVSNIPEGVVVTYNNQTYTGTLAASSAVIGTFYLVKHSSSDEKDSYDEYVCMNKNGTRIWEKLGSKSVNIQQGSDTTTKLSINVTNGSIYGKTTTLKTVTTHDTPSLNTQKLVKTTVPNVTSVGSLPQLNCFVSEEVLSISFSQGSLPSLGTDITVATGSLSDNGTGDSVGISLTAGTEQSVASNVLTDNTNTIVSNISSETEIENADFEYSPSFTIVGGNTGDITVVTASGRITS